MLTGTGTIPALIAPKNTAGKIDRVEHAQHDALLRLDAERAQRVGGAVDQRCEPAIGDGAAIVDEGGLVPAPGREIAPDQIGGGVVRLRHGNAPVVAEFVAPVCSGVKLVLRS